MTIQLLYGGGCTGVRRVEGRPAEDGGSDGALWADLASRAVVMLAPVGADRRRRTEAVGLHVINAWRRDPEDTAHDTLAPSQHRVGTLQDRDLAAAGHQHLGYAEPADSRLGAFYELRPQGVRDACAELGLTAPGVREAEPDADAAAVRAWRAGGVTAVRAFNDEVAFALLAGMCAVGLSALGDLAVFGLDDIPVARFAEAPLSISTGGSSPGGACGGDSATPGLPCWAGSAARQLGGRGRGVRQSA